MKRHTHTTGPRVNNRPVIRRLADRQLQADRGKNLVAVLAVVLTTVLLMTLFTVGGSMLIMSQEEAMRQVGISAHAGCKYLTQEEYQKVSKDRWLKAVSYRITVGDAIDEAFKKLTTEVSYYEDLDAKWSFCYPEAGQMPQKEDELVTSDLVLKALGVPCELGAKVPLTIRIGTETLTKTFTLSGYFTGDPISMAQIICVSKEWQQRVAPVAETSVLGVSQMTEDDYVGRIMADYYFYTAFNIKAQQKALVKRCKFPENMADGMNWAYMTMKVDPLSVFLAVFLLGVILISGYLIIYNVFYISVFTHIHHYGLLKTIGTTEKQLRRIVRRQAGILAVIGIIPGMLIGIFLARGVLPLVMRGLVTAKTVDVRIRLNGWICLLTAVFSYLTVQVSCMKPCRLAGRVSPLEALHYIQRGQGARTAKWRSVLTVLSLSLSLILLNCVHGVASGMNIDEFVSSMVVSDFMVADASTDNMAADYMSRVQDGVKKPFLEDMEAQPGVKETGNIYFYEDGQQFTKKDWSKIEERILSKQIVQDELDHWYGEEEGFHKGEYLKNLRKDRSIDGHTYGMDPLAVGQLKVLEGEIDPEAFATGDYLLVTRYWHMEDDTKTMDFFKPGESVTVLNEKGKQKTYEVMAVVEIPFTMSWQTFGLFNCNYILTSDEFLHHIGEIQPMKTLIDVDEAQEEHFEKWLKNYCEHEDTDLTYKSKASIEAEYAGYEQMIMIIGDVVSLVLAIIGIINFANTMITSIVSRKRELAMLEAVGMTGRQQQAMLAKEGLRFAVWTAACALAVSILLEWTVVRAVTSEIIFATWHFTVWPVVACLPVVFLASVLIPMTGCRIVRKSSVVERIRE